jgi:hypothetical protein
MWPWEHALFAYVFYSLSSRSVSGDPPSGGETFVLVAASAVPDVVDKTLAWQLGAVQSGHGPAHSLLVAAPVGLFLLEAARRAGRPGLGWAYAYGHLLHVVGDLLPASFSEGRLYYEHVLWPVLVSEPTRQYGGLTEGILFHLGGYVSQLLALQVTPTLALQLGAVVAGTALWLADGRPGVPMAGRWIAVALTWTRRRLEWVAGVLSG